MPRIQLAPGEEAVIKTIKHGRIIGLQKWEGRRAYVIITQEKGTDNEQ